MLEQYIIEANSMILKSFTMSPEEKREYLKDIFSNIYHEAERNISINETIKIYQLENILSERMIPIYPIVEASTKLIGTKEQIIEQVVYYARKRFQDIYNCNIKKDSLRDRSKDMINILEDIFRTLNIVYVVIDLGKKIDISSYYISIILVNDELYLIDLTYQQFFILGYNFIDRYYEYPTGVKICEIGGRMIPERKETAISLIEKGYLKCNSISFKEYLDAFMEYSKKEKKNNYTEYLEFILFDLRKIKDKISNKILSKI